MEKYKSKKLRLDQLIIERGLLVSRQRAQTMIMAGKILVADQLTDKPGTMVRFDSPIIIKEDDNPYVSRGGLKLAKAFEVFSLSVKNHVCLDIGASTGGFTDCLLQKGAARVYACDVGYGQLNWMLRKDPRVTVIERTNIRYMDYEVIGQPVDTIVVDTSFISLKKVIPAAEKFMSDQTQVLALIKPQFEAGREKVGKGGIVKSSIVREAVKKDIMNFFADRRYTVKGIVPSPIRGSKGNQEYIIFMIFNNYP